MKKQKTILKHIKLSMQYCIKTINYFDGQLKTYGHPEGKTSSEMYELMDKCRKTLLEIIAELPEVINSPWAHFPVTDQINMNKEEDAKRVASIICDKIIDAEKTSSPGETVKICDHISYMKCGIKSNLKE